MNLRRRLDRDRTQGGCPGIGAHRRGRDCRQVGLHLFLEALVGAQHALLIHQLVGKGIRRDQVRRDGKGMYAAAKPELAPVLVMRPDAAPPGLMVGRRADHRAGKIERGRPVTVLQPALAIKAGQAVDHQMPADEVEQISCLIQVPKDRIMTHQFRQPESACHLSP